MEIYSEVYERGPKNKSLPHLTQNTLTCSKEHITFVLHVYYIHEINIIQANDLFGLIICTM